MVADEMNVAELYTGIRIAIIANATVERTRCGGTPPLGSFIVSTATAAGKSLKVDFLDNGNPISFQTDSSTESIGSFPHMKSRRSRLIVRLEY